MFKNKLKLLFTVVEGKLLECRFEFLKFIFKNVSVEIGCYIVCVHMNPLSLDISGFTCGLYP